jgi:hypothetical protein
MAGSLILDFFIFTIASVLENLFYTQVWHILHVLVPLPGIEGTAQLPAVLSQICTTVQPGQRSSQLRTVSQFTTNIWVSNQRITVSRVSPLAKFP